MSMLQSVSDIFNRPPAIAEDALQYTIYPPAELEDKASATTFAACFQSFAETLLTGFVWHRDGFEVKVVPNPEEKEKWILEGRMRVGDCVDDEWCVVWLLREISSKWEVVIRYVPLRTARCFLAQARHSVYDSDGEFLLIEAADALPSWVQPSNSENRVRPSVHLVGKSHILISNQHLCHIGLDLQIAPSLNPAHTHISTVQETASEEASRCRRER